MRLARVSLATLSLLLLAPVSRAQSVSSDGSNSKPATPQVIFRMSPEWLARAGTHSCPASLDVRHGAGSGQLVATDGLVRKPQTQALDVTVTNHGLSDIVSLDVIVQVRSGKSRLMPLARKDDDLGERLPLHFDMSVKANEGALASWSVANLNAVAYVELSKVEYRDGSSWSAAKRETCQFTPDPMMLISSR